MPWIDPEGNQFNELPQRIRLEDKTTRTDDAVTEEVAIAAGWRWVEPTPEFTISEPVQLNASGNFTISSVPDGNVSL